MELADISNTYFEMKNEVFSVFNCDWHVFAKLKLLSFKGKNMFS